MVYTLKVMKDFHVSPLFLFIIFDPQSKRMDWAANVPSDRLLSPLVWSVSHFRLI